MVLLLDTNILIRYPKLLGLKIPEIDFVITSEVIEELRENSKKIKIDDEFFNLIEKALIAGNISIFNSELTEVLEYNKKLKNVLGKVDRSLISTAQFFRDQNGQAPVKIATLDREVQKVALSNSIAVATDDELKKIIDENIKSQEPFSVEIKDFEKAQVIKTWVSILTGALGSFIATKGYDNISLIISSINIWGTILFIIVLGIALFVIREKQRLSYGVFEFLIGVTAIILLFEPKGFDYNAIQLNMDFSIKLLGGLYIMVRGQDNIVKALKNKKLGLLLKEKFGIGD